MAKLTLQTNFTEKELACKCGCGAMPADHAIIALQNLRQLCGFPFTINSGARCPEHNKREGGKPESEHLEGIAFDIACTESWKRGLILKHAPACGFNAIAIGDGFVHIDTRKDIVSWVY